MPTKMPDNSTIVASTHLTDDVTMSQQRVPTKDGGSYSFTGAELGFGSSRRGTHTHPPAELPESRCSGCRWAEARVYWSETDQRYIVNTIGRTILPGEVDRYQTVWATTAPQVIEALLTPPPRHANRDELELPQPNYDAVEEAMGKDPYLQRALERWEDDEDDNDVTASA